MRIRNASVIVVILLVSTALPLGGAEFGGVDIHGTLSQGYIHSSRNNYIEDSRDGSFEFREYGINASFEIDDELTFGGQVFGRDFGAVGNDDIYLDWLVADYTWRDWLGLRAGKLKVPYGFYGKTRDIDSLRNGVLLPQGVYMEYIRYAYTAALGGSVYGYAPVGAGGLSYSLQYGQRDMSEGRAEVSRLFSIVGLGVSDIDEEAAYAGSLIWHTPLAGLRVGGTWSWSEGNVEGTADSPLGAIPYTADTRHEWLAVGSVEYVRGPLTLATETMYGEYASILEFATPVAPDVDFGWNASGCYLKGDYRFADWLALGMGYSYFHLKQTMEPAAAPTPERVTRSQDDIFLSVRFDLSENLILKVEEHLLFGPIGAFPEENPDGVKDDWSVMLAKLSYLF